MEAIIKTFNFRTGSHAHKVGHVESVSEGARELPYFFTVVPSGNGEWAFEPVTRYKGSSAWVDNSHVPGLTPSEAKSLAKELADAMASASSYEEACERLKAWQDRLPAFGRPS